MGRIQSQAWHCWAIPKAEVACVAHDGRHGRARTRAATTRGVMIDSDSARRSSNSGGKSMSIDRTTHRARRGGRHLTVVAGCWWGGGFGPTMAPVDTERRTRRRGAHRFSRRASRVPTAAQNMVLNDLKRGTTFSIGTSSDSKFILK
jgi:hypothetical protein